MSVNFSIGHIVRTFPALTDGAFDVATVSGYRDEKLVVSFELGGVKLMMPEGGVYQEVWSRFKVEMFAFMGKNGLYELGDSVTVLGYEGTWKVEKFAQNPRSTESEWCAALLHENGGRLFWPAHLLMKVENGKP